MNPRKYWRSLDKDEKIAFAERAGSSYKYLSIIFCRSPSRTPTTEMMLRLANASDGNCEFSEVVNHYMPEIKELAKRKLEQRAASIAEA